MIRVLQKLMLSAAVTVALSGMAQAGTVHSDVPESVNPEARYIIYLHGGWPEIRSLSDPHPKHGLFEYEKIVNALAARGFEVISEHRREKANPRRYARTRILPQINALIEKGVPANRITVAGFSKGGAMSLLVASMAKQPGLNLVNMAGCGRGQFRKSYDNFLTDDASKMQGRMLSLYDSKDQIGGTCKDAKAKSAQLVFKEEVLNVGAGHGTFYSPRKIWIDKVAAWATAPNQ